VKEKRKFPKRRRGEGQTPSIPGNQRGVVKRGTPSKCKEHGRIPAKRERSRVDDSKDQSEVEALQAPRGEGKKGILKGEEQLRKKKKKKNEGESTLKGDASETYERRTMLIPSGSFTC